MEKVKIFGDTNFSDLEKQINDWIAASGTIIISRVLQSQSASDFGHLTVVTIFYR